jgi:NAD(P)-dependent dehydrogenase (short-subunit alcohol dehydrogenase family)
LRIDVTDGTSITSASERVTERTGARGLDGLVNNAGIGLAVPLEHVALADVRRLFEVNVFGPLAVTQALLPALRLARGRIVDIGSIGAHLALPFGGVLNGTKSALAALNDALRLELRPFGIHVVLVEPASIATPAVAKTLGGADEAIRALPSAGAARYGASLRTFMEKGYQREKHGSPPDVVARTVLEALTARRPRSRYRVGKDARPLAWLPRLVPGPLLDRLELRFLGLPAKFGEAPG